MLKDSEKQQKWYQAGLRAAKRGYGDISPFYENATADYFFKCGYTGTSFEEAQEFLKEKIKEIFEQDSTVSVTVNELAQKVSPDSGCL